MSGASELRKAQARNYFEHHPDRVTVRIVGSVESFPGLFDHSFGDGPKADGNVEGRKRRPKISFYYEFATLLTARKTRVVVAGKDYGVFQVEADESRYEGEAWLV